jgi:glycosidase
MLALARDLISLRKMTEDLSTGSYESVAAPEGVWAWRRGDFVLVVLNMSDTRQRLEGFSGRIMIGTSRARDGEAVDGVVSLEAWEGLVIGLERD